MKKIKSFREYIEEQKLLKEADDNENKAGFLKSAEEKVDDREKEITKDNSDESAPENVNNPKPEEQKKEEKSNSSESAYVGEALPVTNATLKIDARTPVGIVDELKLKAEIIERTYKQLDSFVEKEKVVPVGEKHPQAVFNLTNNQTFKTIKETWLKEYRKKIDAQRKNQEGVGHINTLKNTKSFLGYMSKSKKEKMAKARKALDDKFPIEKENNTEEKKDGSVNEEVINEFRNPFITAGELASGIRNKYNRSGVLKQIGNLYGNIENTSIEEMYRKYAKDARALIAKKKKTGWAYLQRAKKNLASYLKKHKYLKKTTDEQFIRTITDDLQRSMNVLYYIGSDLQNLMGEYNKSLNKISNELEVQDIKNKEYVKNSLDSNTAISRYDKKSSDQAVKKGEEEEAEDLETAEEKAKNETYENNIKRNQAGIDEGKQVDAMATDMVLDYLDQASNISDFTPEYLLKLLKSRNKKTSENEKTDERTKMLKKIAKAEAIYVLAKLMADNKLSSFTAGATKKDNLKSREQSDIINSICQKISGNAEQINDETRKLLMSPEEFRDFEKTRNENLKKEEEEKYKKQKTRISQLVMNNISEYINSKQNISINTIINKIKDDLKGNYFTKVEGKLSPKEQAAISALTSYSVGQLLVNDELEPFKEDDNKAIASAVKFIDSGYDYLAKECKGNSKKFNDYLKELLNKEKKRKDFEENQKNVTKIMTGGKPKSTSSADAEPAQNKKQATGTTGSPAKDFDGEQPKSIYAYAIQKAKKLQER